MAHHSASAIVLIVVIVIVVISVVITTSSAVLRKRGYSGMGGDVIVRCSKGHLFTTLWVPGASFKSIRLGMARYQRCPVGKHWAMVRPIKDADLTTDERREAGLHHDLRVP